eukprot:scaffold149_cov315-Pinguiococcus_pyrenoidosus.AAC.35
MKKQRKKIQLRLKARKQSATAPNTAALATPLLLALQSEPEPRLRMWRRCNKRGRALSFRRQFSTETTFESLLRDMRERTLTAPNRCPPSLLRTVHERFWKLSEDAEKQQFFVEAVKILGVRRDTLAQAQEVLNNVRFSGAESDALEHLEDVMRLRKEMKPLYEEIFEGIAREIPGGCRSVVQMRGEVLRLAGKLRRAASAQAANSREDILALRALRDLDEVSTS